MRTFKKAPVLSVLRWVVICLVLFSVHIAGSEDGKTSAQTSSIWDMTVSVTKMFESDTGTIDHAPLEMTSRIYLKEDLALLKLVFDINNKLEVEKKSMKAEYKWLYDNKEFANGSLVAETEGNDTGQELTDWEIGIKRHIQLCDEKAWSMLDDIARKKMTIYDHDEIEEELFKSDQFAPLIDQPVNTVLFKYKVTIPAKATSTTYITGSPSPPEKFEMKQGFEDTITFDYFFGEREHKEDNKKLPLVKKENLGNVKEERNEISYDLKHKKLAIVYYPLKKDMTKKSGAWEGNVFVTDNLARSGDSNWLLHANNETKVFIDGRDVTNNFIIFRLARTATAPLNSKAYENQIKTNIWIYDNNEDDPKFWVDIPSAGLLHKDPGKWPSRSNLFEFMISVDKFPEFGFLYYAIIIDTRPNAYRVRMYKALPVSYNQFCKIIQADKPGEFGYTDNNIAIDTKWLDPKGGPIPALNK